MSIAFVPYIYYTNIIKTNKETEEKKMAEYHISYNDYFGFCVIEKINGTGKIVFAGSIEDCNRKCIELNSQR